MNDIPRRDVVKAAPLIVASSTAFSYQANSQINFGIIGTGGRGQYVGTLMTQGPSSRLAAVCDKYADRIDAAKTKIPGAEKAKSYRDYRDLLNDKSIDAVLIATPVFLHPEHYEAAILAKKHIYCEKPAALMLPVANACSQHGPSGTPPNRFSSASSNASARNT